MRYLAIPLIVLGLVACGTDRATRGESQAATPTPAFAPGPRQGSIDSVAEFLLTAAASDFHAHRPPDPVRFRDVRIGHMTSPQGEVRYVLCGQFLPKQDAGQADWTPFATIKTSGYEQWLGTQAAGWCQGKSIVWDEPDDLSTSLQSRLDSLR